MAHPLTGDAPVAPESPTFAELGVREEIVRALHESGIDRTFAIQELTLPLALAGDDLIGQARTGMGKTLGFGVPLLHRITTTGSGTTTLDGTPRALVVVPTRELAVQVTQDLADASKHLGLRVLSIYGGRPYEPQVAALQKGIDLVVGTPGRLLDLAQQGHLVLGKIGVLVLDEADEMLDLGFLPDIERILRMVPDARQTMLFSATMPGPIITLARTFLTQPTHIRAEEPDSGATHENTAQHVYRAHAMDKVEMLSRVLQARGRGLTMIFTRTKRTAQKVADELAERGFAVGAVHGDLGQGAREQALRAFRTGKIDVLVATDVAARGIDVTDVTHVVNYQCPDEEKTYVHRIGRTGRAGKTGVAVTLVDWDDLPKWKLIDTALDLGMADPVETYSNSPHLFAELDIPEGVTGRLPRSERTRAGLGAESVEDLPGARGSRGASGGGRGGRDGGGSREGGRDGGGGSREGGRDGGGSSREGGRDGGARDGGGRGRRSAPRTDAPSTGDPQTDEPATTGTTTDGDAPPRRSGRRRTRSGAAVAPATEGAPTEHTSTERTSTSSTGGSSTPEAPAASGDTSGTPRRRRRRRGGGGGGGASQGGSAPAGQTSSD
ncbi:DEAD/DEAH box helicase [Rhodococcus antarcticus]|uniref:RNA helicase n=1 Tax=Rhodococcus antarcticus TaxID=2987751 RepID=A0ABY6P5M1_9NOCA|nr:DEAD/DEAH box helicase [Rhodococcus antarcticus]UZJ26646.1 DEAD/DEAH box helicase [Rhodococcus antarcticus]